MEKTIKIQKNVNNRKKRRMITKRNREYIKNNKIKLRIKKYIIIVGIGTIVFLGIKILNKKDSKVLTKEEQNNKMVLIKF